MISEQNKQAILNGAYGITRSGVKAKYVGTYASKNYLYYFIFLNENNDILNACALTKDFKEYIDSTSQLDVIGLWQDKPEPFDLERALAGEPLIDLHNNEKCWLYKSHKNGDLITEYENTYSHLENIEPLEYLCNDLDLSKCFGMWKEPQPESNTVTITLPCPLKEPKNNMWFIGGDGVAMKSDYQKDIPTRTFNKDKFDNGFYFGSKEDTQAWLDALKNSRR